MKNTTAISSIGIICSIFVSACSAAPDVNEDLSARTAAIEHARANTELAEKGDALRQQGWSVTPLDEASVEWLNMPTEGSSTKWTRVTVDLAHGGAVNEVHLHPRVDRQVPAPGDGQRRVLLALGQPARRGLLSARLDRLRLQRLERDRARHVQDGQGAGIHAPDQRRVRLPRRLAVLLQWRLSVNPGSPD